MPALLGRRADRRHAVLATPLPLAAAAYFFPVFVVTLIVNDKGNLHSVWFPAHIWILYKAPLFLPLPPSIIPSLSLIGNATRDVQKNSAHIVI